ncbi:unnamed protein product [Symbiodinium necroappetens]|uniref:Dynactin subunit 4 n=1 Tax=Symbiodinium necroappetens TaxID=1628268 RepID=A0A812RGB2_9DINO|nr:unnamed protein product [Symbiodinium necroappetens]
MHHKQHLLPCTRCCQSRLPHGFSTNIYGAGIDTSYGIRSGGPSFSARLFLLSESHDRFHTAPFPSTGGKWRRARIVSRRDLAEDVDSYYCPHCLENMPSSEEQTYHFACSFCRWSSRGRQEAEKPEQLITQIVALERESEPRQRMLAMVEAFRTKAQDQQREKELAQRLKRRSLTRTSFSSASLTAFAARRFSSAVSMRGSTRLSAMGSSVLSFGSGELGKKVSGPWSIDDLEAKLVEQDEKQKDLRADASLAVFVKESQEPASDAGAKDSPARRFSFSGHAASDVPVLAGLSVQEIMRAHTEPLARLPGCTLLAELQSSIDSDASIDSESAGDCASLGMRLLQVSYGYHGISLDSAKLQPQNILRRGQSQLEAPLQHKNAWKLLPVRKPLLTKRSRRCKLVCKPAGESEAAKICKGLVVKPKINPCANPPFQKNSVASAILPRIIPWSCGTGHGDGDMSLVFIMVNPMDTDVEIDFDPMAFNKEAANLKDTFATKPWQSLLAGQSVHVSTPAFSTIIGKCLDEASNVFDEDVNQHAGKDRPEIILQRKMNKILVRLCFHKKQATTTWEFFTYLKIKFQVSFSDTDTKSHEVELVLRFGPECPEDLPQQGYKGIRIANMPSGEKGSDDCLVNIVRKVVGPDGVLVWDGDEFSEDSFTRILDQALATSKIPAVAFYWSSLEAAFRSSWQHRADRFCGGLHLVLLEDPPGLVAGSDDSWVQLGLDALRLTRAETVLSLGGGGVVAKEAAECSRHEQLKLVHWYLVRIPRLSEDLTDFGALYEQLQSESWSNMELVPIPSKGSQ